MIGESAVLRGGAQADVFRSAAVYHEIQHFPAWVYVISVSPGLFLLVGASRQLVSGLPFGALPMSDAGLAVLTLALLSLPLFLYGLILRMETIVDPGVLTVSFGTFGWIHRNVRLDEVGGVSVVAFRPIRDFGGWGIRYGKGMWCYNTRGSAGVLVTTVQGKSFIVGSQTPKLLESALRGLLPPKA